MASFDMLTIEEATERLIDYRGKTPPKSDSGVRLVTAKVVKGGQIHDEPAEFVAASSPRTLRRTRFRKRTVVGFGRSRLRGCLKTL